MLVCYLEWQSSMLEGSNACGLTKEEEETYVSASQCVSPSLPSLIIETISLGLKSRLFHLFLFPPTLCLAKALKMERKKEATYVSVPHPASPALWDTHDVYLCFIFYFSTKLWWFFSWQLTIGDLVTANSRVCQLSSVQWPRQRWVFEDMAHIFNRSQSDRVQRFF